MSSSVTPTYYRRSGSSINDYAFQYAPNRSGGGGGGGGDHTRPPKRSLATMLNFSRSSSSDVAVEEEDEEDIEHPPRPSPAITPAKRTRTQVVNRVVQLVNMSESEGSQQEEAEEASDNDDEEDKDEYASSCDELDEEREEPPKRMIAPLPPPPPPAMTDDSLFEEDDRRIERLTEMRRRQQKQQQQEEQPKQRGALRSRRKHDQKSCFLCSYTLAEKKTGITDHIEKMLAIYKQNFGMRELHQVAQMIHAYFKWNIWKPSSGRYHIWRTYEIEQHLKLLPGPSQWIWDSIHEFKLLQKGLLKESKVTVQTKDGNQLRMFSNYNIKNAVLVNKRIEELYKLKPADMLFFDTRHNFDLKEVYMFVNPLKFLKQQ